MKNFKILPAVLLAGAFFLQGADSGAVSTESKKNLLPIGSSAPDFTLPDVMTGNTVTLGDFAQYEVLVVMILCRHCPFVQRVKGGISDLSADYGAGARRDPRVGLVAISASDPAAYPADAPESLKEMGVESGWRMPVLFDETQEVAKSYTAVATPDFFVFDRERKLVYRGQMDDSRPDNEALSDGRDVRAAIESALAGNTPVTPLKPAVGCSIKWKKGNEPAYW